MLNISTLRTPHNIAQSQMAPPARPPSRRRNCERLPLRANPPSCRLNSAHAHDVLQLAHAQKTLVRIRRKTFVVRTRAGFRAANESFAAIRTYELSYG